MSEQAESMHDALSVAFDKTEETGGETEIPSTPAIAESNAPAPEPKIEVEPVPAGIPADDTGTGTIQLDDSANTGGDAPSEDAGQKPPQSWGVAEREGWGTLSPEIQNQISKREAEIQKALTHTGEARKFHEEFNQAVQPYLGFIQAEGGTPMSAFNNLMQTAATLQAGAPQQKAQRVAELINHYGIDIQMLDTLLSGQTPESSDDARLGQMLDQRLQPMMKSLNQFEENRVQATQQEEQRNTLALDEFFAQNEFSGDVRHEMADLMEMAGRRGQTLDLKGAYEKALLLRPDIQQVITQRKAAANAQTNKQAIQDKSRAAVSIPGGDAMQGGTPPPDTMRDAIVAAMEK